MPYADRETQLAAMRAAWHRTKGQREVKERLSILRKRQRREKSRWVDEYKSATGCFACPESTAVCLDLHHIDPEMKHKDVSSMLRFYGKDRLMQEIAKCMVVCANCHRKLHAGLLSTGV